MLPQWTVLDSHTETLSSAESAEGILFFPCMRYPIFAYGFRPRYIHYYSWYLIRLANCLLGAPCFLAGRSPGGSAACSRTTVSTNLVDILQHVRSCLPASWVARHSLAFPEHKRSAHDQFSLTIVVTNLSNFAQDLDLCNELELVDHRALIDSRDELNKYASRHGCYGGGPAF